MSTQVFYYSGEKRFYTTADEQGFVFQAKDTTNSTYLGKTAGNLVTGNNNNFLGYQAGYQAIDVSSSNFLGNNAGYGATTASNSNFLGNGAGYGASASNGSHFFGASAGRGATGANNSNFIGTDAGKDATGALSSNFLGASAGVSGAFANNSIFIGNSAGKSAISGANSIFLGQGAGSSTTNANNSIFLGKYAGINRANTLYIDTQSTNRLNNTSSTPLIYGEFDNKLLRVNGTLFATGFGSSLISVGGLQLSGNLLSATGNNQSLILQPNGNGALITDINGDVRGSYANDFQRVRTTNSQVAAGSYSLIGGGSGNFALGNNSVICGGTNNIAGTGFSTIGGGSSNIASGLYSFIPGGYQAKATRQGEFAHAMGSFDNPGDAQTFRVVMRTETVGGKRQLTLNGSGAGTGNTLTIPANTAWQFTIRAAAICSSGAGTTTVGSTAGWHIRGAAKRIGNTSTLVPAGTPPAGSSYSWRDSTFGGPQLDYGVDANHRLVLTGDASSENSLAAIRWVAAVEVTQVSYGTP